MGEFPNKATQFTSENNPSTGRKKGSRNRQTIVREMLERAALKTFNDKLKEAYPSDPNIADACVTIYDQITAALVAKALSGDATAFKELMDSAHGKITDKVENTHTFTQMGKVTVSPSGSNPTSAPNEISQQPAEKTLSFDVGEEIKAIDETETEEEINHE